MTLVSKHYQQQIVDFCHEETHNFFICTLSLMNSMITAQKSMFADAL